MKQKNVFCNTVFCVMLIIVLLAPPVRAGWEDMEVLKYNFDISASQRYEWYPYTEYNSIENDFMVVWRRSGMLRVDCAPGDEYECTNSFQSIHGQRVSPEGMLLGDTLQWSPPEVGHKQVPRLAYNEFSNEYMLEFVRGLQGEPTQQNIAILDSTGEILNGPKLVRPDDVNAFLPTITFNPVHREYLLVYNDRNVFSEWLNNLGFILDEDGNVLHGPFPVGNQVGDFYAPYAAYNPTNNTYLVVWEDFRNVSDWMYDPCDVYGALLDASNGDMITEIAVMDDWDTPGVADQRVPVPCYNSDKNEFLVAWRDDRPPLDDYGLMGRIVGPNGTLEGEEFVLADPPGMQGTVEPYYLEEEKKYFIVWTDTRDASDPGFYYFLSDEADIYGQWLDNSGRPIGDEITLCDSPDVQMHPEMAYDPVMKRFLITWYDWNAPNDFPLLSTATGIGSDMQGDVRGTIYGVPSFLSGRIIEEGTGSPVEDARVLVIGPSLPALKKTNVGGWFNIEKESQAEGKYLVVVFKLGYNLGIQSVVYTGEPQQVTLKAKRYGRRSTTTTTIITTTTTVDQTTTTTTASTSSRFIDNDDGTVTDSLTGLTWLKVATCVESMDWDAALSAVAEVSDGDCGFEGTLSDGSNPGDWRMPTKEEMQGLGTEPPTTWEEGRPPVDWTLVGGTTLTPFLYIQGNCFWTSTSDTDNAWVLCSGDGWVGLRDKTSYTYFVWPIRRDSN